MTPPGGGPRRIRIRPLRLVAAVVLGAVAAAGGIYTVQRARQTTSSAPVTGSVSVPGPSLPPGPLDDAGPPDATLPPQPVTVNVHQVVVPILLYHYVRVNRHPGDLVGFNLSVTPEHFAEQMALLVATGAHTITFTDLIAALHGAPLPPHPVMLTFDDGYDDFYTAALPVLVRDHLRAVSYVVSGFVGKPGYMSAAQVRAVAAAGMVVGDHTVNHVALAHVSLQSATQQIDVSRQQLEALIDNPVVDFAYPYGDWSQAVARLIALGGFRDAVTTDIGNVHDLASLYSLTRIRIGGTDTLASFAEKAGVPVVPLPPSLLAPTASPSPPPATPGARSASPSAPASPTPTAAPVADRVIVDQRGA